MIQKIKIVWIIALVVLVIVTFSLVEITLNREKYDRVLIERNYEALTESTTTFTARLNTVSASTTTVYNAAANMGYVIQYNLQNGDLKLPQGY